MTMSSSTRSGTAFSTLRSAAAPSSATLSLYSSRSASTRMSTLVLTSSTMRTRLSERSFTSVAPAEALERLRQLRLRVFEGITLDERLEIAPRPVAEERREGGAIRFDEIGGARIELREEGGELHRRLAGLAGVGRRRCGRRWNAGPARIERGPQARHQRRQPGRDLLCRTRDRVRLGAIVNQPLQRAGRSLHRGGADVARHALERVREPLGQRQVAPGQRIGNLLDRRTLLLGELAEELPIEFVIAAHAPQPVLRIE